MGGFAETSKLYCVIYERLLMPSEGACDNMTEGSHVPRFFKSLCFPGAAPGRQRHLGEEKEESEEEQHPYHHLKVLLASGGLKAQSFFKY